MDGFVVLLVLLSLLSDVNVHLSLLFRSQERKANQDQNPKSQDEETGVEVLDEGFLELQIA